MSLHLWDLELLSAWLSLWSEAGPTSKGIFELGGPMPDPDYLETDAGLYQVNTGKYAWADVLDWYFQDTTDCSSFAGTVDALDADQAASTVVAYRDGVFGGHWGIFTTRPK